MGFWRLLVDSRGSLGPWGLLESLGCFLGLSRASWGLIGSIGASWASFCFFPGLLGIPSSGAPLGSTFRPPGLPGSSLRLLVLSSGSSLGLIPLSLRLPFASSLGLLGALWSGLLCLGLSEASWWTIGALWGLLESLGASWGSKDFLGHPWLSWCQGAYVRA